MPINNKALYDAVLAGSCISNDTWITNTTPANYSREPDASCSDCN